MLDWNPRFVIKNTFLDEISDVDVKGKFKRNITDPCTTKFPRAGGAVPGANVTKEPPLLSQISFGRESSKRGKAEELGSASSKEEPELDAEARVDIEHPCMTNPFLDQSAAFGDNDKYLDQGAAPRFSTAQQGPFFLDTRVKSADVHADHKYGGATKDESVNLRSTADKKRGVYHLGERNVFGQWDAIGSNADAETVAGQEEPEAEPVLTTMMLRNVPNRYTQKELVVDLRMLGFVPGIDMDFFYLPIDLTTGGNLGYCFVNLVQKDATERFKNLHGERLPRHYSRKSLIVNLATCQGLQENWEHYQRSSVINAEDSRRPLFWPTGPSTSWIPVSETHFDVPNSPAPPLPNMGTHANCWLAQQDKVSNFVSAEVKLLNFCGSCGQKRGDPERFCTACGARF
eukprot:GEMP01052956.1.p1 GENE.GEMP01052956.1~~GEMP01052956.1.p1  ORF type:complete len:401 (+),score=92.96 GEMP01052956.1:59-1261(+)